MIFRREFINLLYDSGSWPLDIKVTFFPIQKSDILITILCLIEGVSSIKRVLNWYVVLQKTNNVVVRCHSCWVPFFRCVIFDERSAFFVTLCRLGTINVTWF